MSKNEQVSTPDEFSNREVVKKGRIPWKSAQISTSIRLKKLKRIEAVKIPYEQMQPTILIVLAAFVSVLKVAGGFGKKQLHFICIARRLGANELVVLFTLEDHDLPVVPINQRLIVLQFSIAEGLIFL